MLGCIQILVNVRQQNSAYVCVHFCAHLRLNLLNIYVTVKKILNRSCRAK